MRQVHASEGIPGSGAGQMPPRSRTDAAHAHPRQTNRLLTHRRDQLSSFASQHPGRLFPREDGTVARGPDLSSSPPVPSRRRSESQDSTSLGQPRMPSPQAPPLPLGGDFLVVDESPATSRSPSPSTRSPDGLWMRELQPGRNRCETEQFRFAVDDDGIEPEEGPSREPSPTSADERDGADETLLLLNQAAHNAWQSRYGKIPTEQRAQHPMERRTFLAGQSLPSESQTSGHHRAFDPKKGMD